MNRLAAPLLPLLLSVGALTLVACASQLPLGSSTINTRALKTAPATQQESNVSKPLSELDTPEAIAAREAASKAGLSAEAESPQAAPEVDAPPVVEPASATPLVNTDPHQQLAAFHTGARVGIRNGAPLYARPNGNSESVQSVVLDSTVVLGPQIYNASGYWYYVTVGKETGWVLQTDLVP